MEKERFSQFWLNIRVQNFLKYESYNPNLQALLKFKCPGINLLRNFQYNI